MATVQSLNQDNLFLIKNECSSSIDIWNFLIALGYRTENIRELRGFWKDVNLSALFSHQDVLRLFAKTIGPKCSNLRLDHVDSMLAADLRYILTKFRSVIRLQLGRIGLRKKMFIDEFSTLFPDLTFFKILLIIECENGFSSSAAALTQTNLFGEFLRSLENSQQLERISVILQDKEEALTSRVAEDHFCQIAHHTTNFIERCSLISIEENGSPSFRRLSWNKSEQIYPSRWANLLLHQNLKHFIVSFRPMPNIKLRLEVKNPSNTDKLSLKTLVLPWLPSQQKLTNLFHINQLEIFEIGFINIRDRIQTNNLDEVLREREERSLENLTLILSEQPMARLTVASKKTRNNSEIESEKIFDSVFSNCFEPSEDSSSDEDEQPKRKRQKVQEEECSSIDEYYLYFIDEHSLPLFQLKLNKSSVKLLTNLNLTGVHCHSMEFRHIFESLEMVRSLSVPVCLLVYIDQTQCNCQKEKQIEQFHSIKLRNLVSLNLISFQNSVTEKCPILVEQSQRHSIRFSPVHISLKTNLSNASMDDLIRSTTRSILRNIDLQHFSLRAPNFRVHRDDFILQNQNHLNSFILDVRLPLDFHVSMNVLFNNQQFVNLRRLCLMTNDDFQFTATFFDRLRTLEKIEVITHSGSFKRSTMTYFEKFLTPKFYPNLTLFRYWTKTIENKTSFKKFIKKVQSEFDPIQPAFQLDVGTVLSFDNRLHSLFDQTDSIHRDFHQLNLRNSKQLSIVYPNFLNYKPLYSSLEFN